MSTPSRRRRTAAAVAGLKSRRRSKTSSVSASASRRRRRSRSRAHMLRAGSRRRGSSSSSSSFSLNSPVGAALGSAAVAAGSLVAYNAYTEKKKKEKEEAEAARKATIVIEQKMVSLERTLENNQPQENENIQTYINRTNLKIKPEDMTRFTDMYNKAPKQMGNTTQQQLTEWKEYLKANASFVSGILATTAIVLTGVAVDGMDLSWVGLGAQLGAKAVGAVGTAAGYYVYAPWYVLKTVTNYGKGLILGQ